MQSGEHGARGHSLNCEERNAYDCNYTSPDIVVRICVLEERKRLNVLEIKFLKMIFCVRGLIN